MKLPIIYKRTQTGAIQQWEIIVEDDTFYTIEGQVGGKLTTSKPTQVIQKNVGKQNETNEYEQALKEAQAKWKKKTEAGYTEDINLVDTSKKFFEPMLAHKYIDYKNDIIFPILVSPKLDGCRMVAQKSGLWTRNGKPYVSCPHIQKILKPLFEKYPNWVIDGEVYTHDVSFEKVVSLVKQSKPTKEDLEESAKLVQYWIFDGVVDDKSLGFEDRYKLIREELTKLIGHNPNIKFVTTIKINSDKEVEEWHDAFVSKGFEGCMLRKIDAPYENKRSKNLLKFKKFLDEEFKIIDVQEVLGSRSGMAGKLLLEMKNGKIFGAGIRGGEDYYRQLLLDKKKLIGKVATIRYQNLSEDGVPRFPIAVNIAPIDR
jgi:DNA ligase-1